MYRLRIIAGPNGSGKTTLTKDLQNNYRLNFGYYINADEIEAILKINGKLAFSRYRLKINQDRFTEFFVTHPLHTACENVQFTVKRNTLQLTDALGNFSYFTALLADFLRQQIMESKQTFTFETVMSGKDKIGFVQTAKQNNYRVYLYFITTDDVFINKDRVANRVEKGGHPVPEDKIEKRYYGSLENLLEIIKLSNRAYLFDNSGSEYRLAAEITEGKEVNFDPGFVPNWFEKYVLNKLRHGDTV